LPRRAQGTAVLNLYPSLPEFTQTWTPEFPQFPPSGAQMHGARDRRARGVGTPAVW
jgi:hypothetical protein